MAELDLVEGIENGMADRSLWAGGQILHLFRGCGMSPYSGDNRVEVLRHDTRAGARAGTRAGTTTRRSTAWGTRARARKRQVGKLN
jgi:hypothetical protein